MVKDDINNHIKPSKFSECICSVVSNWLGIHITFIHPMTLKHQICSYGKRLFYVYL